MEVLYPGYVIVPSQKRNVVLADNSGVQPNNVGHVMRTNYHTVGDTAFNTESLSGFLLNSLSAYLLKDGFYQEVKRLYRNDLMPVKDEEEDYMRSGRLSEAKLQKISRDTSMQLLFSLDRLLTKTITNVSYTGDYYRATRDVWVNSVLRIYDLQNDTLICQFQYNDSLFWEKFSTSSYHAIKQLPEMADVLPEVADVVAEHISKFLGPHWETAEREYFCTGSYRMNLAADLVRRKSLDEAAALWQMEYNKSLFRTKYRSAINMMFYEEVKGNPSEALVWGRRAEKAMNSTWSGGTIYDTELLKQWKKILEERVQEYEKLKIYFDGNLN